MLERTFQKGREKWEMQNLNPYLNFQDLLKIVTSLRCEEEDELYELRPASLLKAPECSVLCPSLESTWFS